MNLEPDKPRAQAPTSELWGRYYDEAKKQRRGRGRSGRTSREFKRWRRRQRALLSGAVVTLGILVAIFYAVLGG